MEEIFIKRFKRQLDNWERVKRYYLLLMTLNDIYISKQQLDLLVFIALKGGMNTSLRGEFANKMKTTIGNVDNCVSALKKKQLIEETKKREYVAILPPELDKVIKLEITLNGEAIHQSS